MSVDILQEQFVALSEDLQQEAMRYIDTLSNLQSKRKEELPFWELMKLIDWEASGSFKATLPIETKLSKLEDEFIFKFQDFLAEKLSDLDGPAYHGVAARGLSGSMDAFLYARCYVIANGANFYYHVLINPHDFPDEWFEGLLYTPERAYERKHGKDLERLPAKNYETGFNPDLWGEKHVAAKMAMFKAPSDNEAR